MSDTEVTGELNPEDVMKILVATDIHLGYNEKHSLRGKYKHNLLKTTIINVL